ncbi:MAG: rhomboid family intramembrane serine protease [Rhodocyclaceae bacterium]|nr:rhomboid family intramembrane serine protease [Rhodocyclaceae bacterium]
MFLAFPLNDKPDWRRPPVFTLLIILINCIVFFGPQRADETREEKAAGFYQKSDLPAFEMPRYLEALQQRSGAENRKIAHQVERMLAAEAYVHILPLMENDAAFMAELRRRRDADPAAEIWRAQRRKYDALRGERFTGNWMFTPAEQRWETLFTSIFLHGSVGHLIGNMIFLFAFGYTVELTLGAFRFVSFYLLAGIGGGLLQLATSWGSPIGCLGASGAISGLMAMYACLYGRRSIRFFYQLFFYFDHVRAPAWILVPAWLANELIQFVVFKDSGIGYMAHAGGLLTGTALILLYKRTHAGATVPDSGAAAIADSFPADLARAGKLLEQLKLDDARQAYAGLCRRRPHDLALLTTYAGLAKLVPASEDFHHSAALIFAFNAVTEEEVGFVRDTWARYLKDALPRPRLDEAQLLRLGMLFVRHGLLADAMSIETMMLRLAPHAAGLASLRLALVGALLKQNRRSEAAALAQALQAQMPEGVEARLAVELLTNG